MQKNSIYAENLIKRQSFKDAIDILITNTNVCKDHIDTYNCLGVSYFQIGDYDKAVEYLKVALDLAPKNEAVRLNYDLAMKYKQMKPHLHPKDL